MPHAADERLLDTRMSFGAQPLYVVMTLSRKKRFLPWSAAVHGEHGLKTAITLAFTTTFVNGEKNDFFSVVGRHEHDSAGVEKNVRNIAARMMVSFMLWFQGSRTAVDFR